ncbi:hypothetical protein ACFXDE_31955 [Kitasatospora sp. NPDC059408]|uniref:hypothetical protein n=1 Tax=Kitasatospora sp. NPDC059408 TaxID=3346823 RepID=UPI0036A05FEE
MTVAPATLAADPGQGAPGSATTVSGTGFACPAGDAVALAWDTGAPPVSGTPDADGHLATRITVPPDATVGDHTVRASCASVPGITADAHFHALAPAPTPTPSSSLSPVPSPVRAVTASPGAVVRVSGRASACPSLVLALDNGPTSHPIQADGSGRFTALTTLPPNVSPGPHSIAAECADTHTVAQTIPIVVTTSASSSRPHDRTWLWIVLGAAVLASAAALTLRHRLRPPPVTARVTAAPGTWGNPETGLTEHGGGGDAAGHSVRLEPKPGRRLPPSFEELHDDDRRDG